MNNQPYGVYVIVDPNYGNRLRDILAGEPVWIADTAINHTAVATIWKDHGITSHLSGLTSFVIDPNATPEDWLISEIATIDLHHGEYSHKPPWSIITVIGVQWTKRIKEELEQFGFTKHEDTTDGFIARK